MILFPNAKINIGLHVIGKHVNGYHEISTILHPISYCDILEIKPSKKMCFSVSGLSIPGQGNFCLDAYNLIKSDFNISDVHIHLHKVIPIGAGLGGGSSDAAFTLKGLNELFDLKISDDKLCDYAFQIGSDCPFFIRNKSVLATGFGEVFKQIKLDLSGYFLVVVTPDIHVSTVEAYSSVVLKKIKYPLLDSIHLPIKEWKAENVFEKSIFQKYPEIKSLKDHLYQKGAVYASMSGSGSSVFGFFKELPELNFPKYSVFYS